MARQYSLPFQVLATLRVAALVLTLTAIFLWFVLGRVQEQIEQSGRENFRMLAHNAFGDLDALTQSHLRYLDTLAKLLPTLEDPYTEQSTRALAQTFLLQSGPNALAITRPNGDMQYFLKRDPEAPSGTAYTIGHLRAQPDGMSITSDIYYTAEHSVLGRRNSRITLRATEDEWYRGAMHSDTGYLSQPYPIPGWNLLGITLSTRSGNNVVTLTTPIDLIDRLLEQVSMSANSATLLLDDQQRMVAHHTQGALWHTFDANNARMQQVTQLGDPVLAAAVHAMNKMMEDEIRLVSISNQSFLLAWHSMKPASGTHYRLLLLTPLSDLSQVAAGARRDVWIVTLVALVILLPITWLGTGVMAQVLQRLVENSQRIGRLNFEPLELPLHTSVREIRALGLAHESMRNALATGTRSLERVSRHLAQLIGIGTNLVQEKNRVDLLNAILGAAREMTGAEVAILFLRDDDDMLRPAATIGMAQPDLVPALNMNLPELQRESLTVYTAIKCIITVVDDLDNDSRDEVILLRHHNRNDPSFHAKTAASLPLYTSDKHVVGVMLVINASEPERNQIAPFSGAQVTYLEALAAQATVALENQKLITSQRRLLDTLVRTLGDAVDAKSAYTGRHCARVPELAMMLAQEAHAADSGPLAEFAFRTEEEWYEFRTGAWLHDCGKITSPEHVMDKATKLETVYNRLHEVRTRFEVLLRDARIETLQAQLDGHMDASAAKEKYTQRAQVLQEQYAIIARCNLGSEKMAAEDIARVRAIGQQTWLRHFDNHLGLSHEELARHHDDELSLPATEPLLADKHWQVIERTTEEKRALTEGFRMQVPEHLYNHGELYNLCIERGTLTLEERFKINEHIIHTIRMLEGANFPAHLRRVPEYAGTHHETMDGSGYPRGLTAAELSIPARIMAIADIFEALTAADRPYKAAKPLSESIAILHRMKLKGHIDPDLFDLFLRKGVHLRYAQRFLAPDQIDMPDITPYLG